MGLFDDDEDDKPEKKERTYTMKEFEKFAKLFGSSRKKAKKE